MLLFFALLLVISGSIIYWTFINGISPMPTSPRVKKKMLQIPCELSDGPIYELGSGWGTLAFALADKHPTHRVEAFETSLVPYFYCRCKNYFSPRDNLHFHRSDFFSISLNDAALVVCYLYPAAMKKLRFKFLMELPVGSSVISSTFAIPHRTPSSVIEVQDLYRTKIYLYKF